MNRVLMLMFLCVPIVLWAQRPPIQEKQKELQERMVEVSLSEIQERLNLTEMQISQLRPVYKQYQKRVARLNMLNHKLFNRMNADTLSDEKAQTVLREYLDREHKLYVLNKQYMDNLLEILSPQQVIKLYQSDSDIKRKIRMEYLRRTGKPKR
ncbi:hypothetical protein [uncultured Coprobacter sp.]|uniref:hypothetical protein n=1 Tax=uncultured Coprobacter sp. TaxID=1720550 RepID=UPI0026318835|nr:hypothetical protein [uncultured Coprobacter sp.]